jgi:hypothetical protein
MSNDGVKNNLIIEKNLIVKDTISSRNLLCTNIHGQSIEGNQLYLNGDLIIRNPTSVLPSGGFSSTGDFFISATTTQHEWTPAINFSTFVVNGNSIGQLCQVYIELVPQDDVDSESIVFDGIPESFFPKTKLSFPVTILTDEYQLKQGLFVFDPLLKKIKFYGDWKSNEILTATLMYIRV